MDDDDDDDGKEERGVELKKKKEISPVDKEESFINYRTRRQSSSGLLEPRKLIMTEPTELRTMSYNPVYNIREIRTACHSFSSLGIDKKLLDIQINNRSAAAAVTQQLKRNKGAEGERTTTSNTQGRRSAEKSKRESNRSSLIKCGANNGGNSSFSKSTNNSNVSATGEGSLEPEEVNTNGKFLYI